MFYIYLSYLDIFFLLSELNISLSIIIIITYSKNYKCWTEIRITYYDKFHHKMIGKHIIVEFLVYVNIYFVWTMKPSTTLQ